MVDDQSNLTLAKVSPRPMFGGQLSWEEMLGKRGCRVAFRMNSGGYRDDKQEWPRITKEMVGAMDRLSKALEPEMRDL